MVAERLSQPFRQAFREDYAVDPAENVATATFARNVVAIRPLLGLAVREGWRTDNLDGVLRRDCAAWRVVLHVDGPLFPGAEGWGEVGTVHLEERAGDRWARLAWLAARPLGDSGRMRREALVRVLAGVVDADRVTFGDRHVHVGEHAVHLATGRVTRDGEPVAVEVAGATSLLPLPWLPYDEQLLERIARVVTALLEDGHRGADQPRS